MQGILVCLLRRRQSALRPGPRHVRRALLRAWATRTRGDEARRAALQDELGTSDETAAALCRWMAGQARLRAFRLLLERSA